MIAASGVEVGVSKILCSVKAANAAGARRTKADGAVAKGGRDGGKRSNIRDGASDQMIKTEDWC